MRVRLLPNVRSRLVRHLFSRVAPLRHGTVEGKAGGTVVN